MVFEACVMIIKNVFYHKKIVSYFSLEYVNRFKNTTLSPFFFKIKSLAWLENDIRNVNRRRKRSKRGGKFDIQKSIEKLGVEFHPYSFKKKQKISISRSWNNLEKNDSHVVIQVSTDWTESQNNMISTTLKPDTSKINGKLMIKWSQPLMHFLVQNLTWKNCHVILSQLKEVCICN